MLEKLYYSLETFFLKFHVLFNWLGYERLERPVLWIEKPVKSLLFDCRMCGMCALTATGMTCPMNCPKQLRNGPCGGVRQDGFCEVEPDMPCVWVEAEKGAAKMQRGRHMEEVQVAVNSNIQGSSSWLRALQQHHEKESPHEV